VPTHNIQIDQGNQTFVTSGTTLAQPLTQLIRVRQANRIAASEIASSRDDLKKFENEVAVRVHELYYGILVTRLQKLAADQERAYAETRLRENEDDVRNGSALKVAAIESRAGLLQSEQTALTADFRLSDLTTELNDVLGLPLDSRLELVPVERIGVEARPRNEYLRIAWSENPQILAAMETVEQAKAGVTAAKSAYIPDVSAVARQSYQNGVPFVVHNFGTFGLTMTYQVFDFGKRRAAVREREAKLAQAEENLERLKEAVSVQIERSYNKVERTRQMVSVAAEVVKLRLEGERLAENQMTQGVVLVSSRRQASAASYKAQADVLQAQLAYLLAGAELEQAAGRTPGL
jgi:outer membrane protein TolC